MAKKKATAKKAAKDTGKTTMLGGMVEIVGLPKAGRQALARAISKRLGSL